MLFNFISSEKDSFVLAEKIHSFIQLNEIIGIQFLANEFSKIWQIFLLEKMASLYLGIRLPEKPFERLKITNIDLITKNVADLKIEAEKLLNFPHKELGMRKYSTNQMY